MNYDDEMVSTQLEKLSAPQRSGRKWFLVGGLALALMLALVGVGAIMGSVSRPAQASALTSTSVQTLSVSQSSSNDAQTLAVAPRSDMNNQHMFAAGPGAQGQGPCERLTVSSVNGATIVGKTSSGSSVTIHTTASTTYRQAGKTVAASSIKVGTQIDVMGTHNSDGSITATSIDIG